MHENIAHQFEQVVGEKQLFRHGEKLSNACSDFFGHWEGIADALIFPENTEQIAECLEVCSRNRITVTVQGGKTGLVAGSVPSKSEGGVIINLTRLKQIREIDIPNRSVVVDAGVTIAELNSYLAKMSMHFPISIGSETESKIGGMISTNAGGYRVFRHGMARHQLPGIEAVLSDGRNISNLRALRKDNVGYGFAQLQCGAEGTLGIVTKAALKVLPQPRQCVTALLSIIDI